MPRSELPDSVLVRLRQAVPVGVAPNDTGALLVGVVAGGPNSVLLAGASVAAYPLGSGKLAAVETDARGQFVLPLAPGRYRLRFRRLGSVEVTHDLQLLAGVIDSVCVNLPERIVKLHADCIGPAGKFGSQYCRPLDVDTVGSGRPGVRCS